MARSVRVLPTFTAKHPAGVLVRVRTHEFVSAHGKEPSGKSPKGSWWFRVEGLAMNFYGNYAAARAEAVAEAKKVEPSFGLDVDVDVLA